MPQAQSWFDRMSAKYKSTAPTAQVTTTPPPKAQAPEDFFANLFAHKQPAQSTTTPPPATTPWDITPEDLSTKFGGLDVAKYVQPEQLTKALDGDAAALMSILGTVAQVASVTAYQQAVATAKSGVEAGNKQLETQLPDVFKKLAVASKVGNTDTLSAPHLKPIVDMISAKILSEYPHATDAEVATGVQEYLTTIGAGFAPKQEPSNSQSTTTTSANAPVDWANEFANMGFAPVQTQPAQTQPAT